MAVIFMLSLSLSLCLSFSLLLFLQRGARKPGLIDLSIHHLHLPVLQHDVLLTLLLSRSIMRCKFAYVEIFWLHQSIL